MDIAAGYKMTEVGVIPEDWDVVKFDDVFDFSTSSIKTEDFDAGNYVSTENLLQQKKGVMPYLSDIPYASVKEYFVNDILISNIRPYLKKIWLSDKNAGCSSDVLVIRCKANGLIIPSFAYYPLSDDKFFSYTTDTAIGTKMPRGDKKAIREYKFALPSSTDEQVRISKVISDFDKYIEGVDIEIAKKKLLKEGVMQELLTGKTRLAGFSGEWVEKRLGDFGGIIRGVSYTPEQSSLSPKDNYICLLRSNNIQNGNMVFSDFVFVDKINVNEQQMVINNDILVCMANGSKQLVGKSAIIDESDEYTFGAFMGVFRCYKSKQAQFVISLFHSGTYRKQIEDILTGSAINNLNASSVESLTFLVPPTIEEQTAIADILSDLDAEIKALEAERDKYALIKQGMMQKLLTGQIRLK